MELGHSLVPQHLELEFALSKDCSYQQFCVTSFGEELFICYLL